MTAVQSMAAGAQNGIGGTIETKGSALAAGFHDPIHDSQAVFRGVLDVLSKPGTLVSLSLGTISPPNGLNAATFALGLTLFDLQSPVCLSGGSLEASKQQIVYPFRFHCGCRFVDDPHESAFAIATEGSATPTLASLSQGSDLYPEESTTLIVQVSCFTAGTSVSISGPGIREKATLNIAGVGDGFWEQRADLESLYPRGVDIIFTCGSDLIGLPRSSRVEA